MPLTAINHTVETAASRSHRFVDIIGLLFWVSYLRGLKSGINLPRSQTLENKPNQEDCWLAAEERENWTMAWWAHQDLNLEPTDYESAALTVELWARWVLSPLLGWV